MAPYKTRCPKCERKLMLPKSTGHLRCPKCGHRFVVNGSAESYPVAAAAPASLPATIGESGTTTSETKPLESASQYVQAVNLPVDEETLAEEETSWSPAALVTIGLSGALVLGLGVWLILFCLRAPATPENPTPEPFVELPPPAAPTIQPIAVAAPLIVFAAAKSDPAPMPPLPAKLAPLTGAVKPVIAAGHPNVDQAKIEAAIERGAVFLAGAFRQNGRVGAQALAGLTLLHCGRANTDPAVLDIVRTIRNRAPTETQTYDLALCVMFLDRFGDPADRPLIRSIALQLIAGQGVMGGWNYGCPALNDAQRQQLLAMLETRSATTPAPERPPVKQVPQISFGGRGALLPANLDDLPVFQHRPGTLLQFKPHGHEDNSLTQFAILSLWAAQKHGITAERSLAFAEARFRSSQGADGTWGYTWSGNRTRNDSMTCAGLLGLAVGRGTRAVSKDSKLKEGDPAIDKALSYVGQRIGNLEGSAGKRGKFIGAATWGDLYYLWTLERAAVAYDLQSIGGKDWYAWGAPIIVAQQNADGGWSEAHGQVVDTCFALLFLKRANVAVDLTVRLQELALSKHIGERRGADPAARRGFDPFDRRPDLDQIQREAAGYSRGRMDER